MAIIFRDYDLLVQSGLFDAAYYVTANPDITLLNIDPLLHYVEQGARQGRPPRLEDLQDGRGARGPRLCPRFGGRRAGRPAPRRRHRSAGRDERRQPAIERARLGPRAGRNNADLPVHGRLGVGIRLIRTSEAGRRRRAFRLSEGGPLRLLAGGGFIARNGRRRLGFVADDRARGRRQTRASIFIR